LNGIEVLGWAAAGEIVPPAAFSNGVCMRELWLGLVLVFCMLARPLSAVGEGKIKIGVPAPLTGEAAVFGEDIRDVLSFAQRHFGDAEIELMFQDDKCAGKEGASTAQYFLQQRVSAVIGYACVEAIMPAIPIFQAAKIPVLSLLASGPDITAAGKNVFNMYPSDSIGVRVLIDRLTELGLHKILVLTAASAFPIGITNAFKVQTQGIGNFKSSFVDYPEKTSEFRALLLKSIKSAPYDAIFINYSSPSEFIAFIKQRRQLHLPGRVFTSYLNGFDAIQAEGALPEAEGVEFYDTAPIEATLRPEDRNVFEKYLREKGHLKSSDGYFPFIYNGYAALRSAIRNSKDGGIGSLLAARTFVDGVGGAFHFNNRGEVEGGPPFVMKKVVGGKVAVCRRGDAC
jgi:ABC-type branched-subunit amino acid transport system substrate-binding protein